MSDDAVPHAPRLSLTEMERILRVTTALATPFELDELLNTVSQLARDVLHAERVTLWLYEPQTETLSVEISADLPPLRVPLTVGIVGLCASTHATIHVPDCYADPRFNPEIDRLTGFRTRGLISLPLVDHQDELVGVLQIVNRLEGDFDQTDISLAQALAAQCAVALTRVRLTRSLLAAERLRHEMELARTMQLSSLPTSWPALPGYAMHAFFVPASLTGGDTFDLATTGDGLLVVLGDAAGHGLAPALAVMQMQAMLRMALRVGMPLEQAFQQVNDQLAQHLPDGHFVNAFIGLLDPARHLLRYVSGGQGPIVHFRAATADFEVLPASHVPMGLLAMNVPPAAREMHFAPGDWLALISDGVYECPAPDGQPLGKQRVLDLLAAGAQDTPAELAQRLLDAVHQHAAGAAQDDDITGVLLQRLPHA